ncbi:adenosine receptor A2b-like [Ptychodera flava]|uniref:adenosine receptor A2b-like n=1 Tax=Ptychodera flava TaxID=63121 RepID=UPI00396A0764
MDSNSSTNNSSGDGFSISIVPAPILTMYLTVAALCVTLNAGMIAVVYMDKKLHTIPNMLVCSMAVTDLLVGVANIPLYIASKFSVFRYLYQCILALSFTIFLSMASTYHLLLIAVDRYLSIVYALRYGTMMTNVRACSLLAFLWLWSLIVSILPTIGWRKPEAAILMTPLTGSCRFGLFFVESYAIAISVNTSVAVATMFILYGCIFKYAREQTRKILATAVTQETSKNSFKESKLKQNIRTCVVLFVIMGCYLLCMIPSNVILAIEFVGDGDTANNVPYFAGTVMAFFNSALNPLIYGSCNRPLRLAIKSRLLRIRCKKKPTLNLTT